MISPENQRFAIEQYAARENIKIIDWVEGIDESGSRKKSAWWAKLDNAIGRVEAREADVLVVWRIDRTARSRVKWAVATDRVETAGGYIESATEPNDRSPAGRFGRGVMAEHAAFMAESIGATWKETLERRVRHGLTPNGARHFGYTYSKADGYQIDPVEGPRLAEMYESYAAGESGWSMSERFSDPHAAPNASGHYPRYARWNTAAILRVLDSGFGAGFILFRKELHPGAHKPVISQDLWARYLEARERRRRRPRAERSKYLYSGMIYCHCGSRMSGRTDHGVMRYGCQATLTYKGRKHPSASVSEALIDAAVQSWLTSIRDELNNAAQNAPRRPRLVEDPKRDISAKLAGVNQRIDTATMRYLDDLIPQDAYERVRSKLEAERASLESELTRVAATQTVAPVAFIGDIVSRWPSIPVEQRRAALALLLEQIIVHPRGTDPRVTIASHLEAS